MRKRILTFVTLVLAFSMYLIPASYAQSTLAPYTSCIDPDGDGFGITSSNSSCTIPARVDLANQKVLSSDFFLLFDPLSFQMNTPECRNLDSFTQKKGCYNATYSTNSEFNQFASDNSFSKFGAVSKFYPAGNNSNPLDKVMVIVSPHNSTGFANIESEIGWVMRQSSGGRFVDLLQYFHNEGISILYVSLNHPSSNLLPIEDSSRALVSVLNQFNKIRAMAPQRYQEPLNLLGLSAGGVVAKFAMSKIEKQGSKHNVRIYMSMDSPHFGANVPASLQAIPLYMKDAFAYAARKTDLPDIFRFILPFSISFSYLFDRLNSAIDDANDVFDLSTQAANEAAMEALGSIPAKELISFNALFRSSDFRSPEHTAFLNSGRSHPMPKQTTVNIGIANGSLTGNLSENGDVVVVEGNALKDYLYLRTSEKKGTRLTFQAKPAGAGTGPYFFGELSFPNRNALYLKDRTYTQKWTNESLRFSRDLAPCSTTEEIVDRLASELDIAIQDFWSNSSVEIRNNKSCFIPVGSALAINVTYPMLFNEKATASQSQFDEIIGTDKNTPHLHFGHDITQQMIASLKRHRIKQAPIFLPLLPGSGSDPTAVPGINNLKIKRYSRTTAELSWDTKPGFELAEVDVDYFPKNFNPYMKPIASSHFRGSRTSAYLKNVNGSELRIVVRPKFTTSSNKALKSQSIILPAHE